MPRHRYCAVCEKLLVGKQSRFCSEVHKNLFWNEARHRGIEVPGITPDVALADFFRDIWRVMETHYPAIAEAIAKRRNS